LALGLGLGGLGSDAVAAPATPPPPRITTATPPPPASGKTTGGKSAGPSPFLPTGPSTTPPPPTATNPVPGEPTDPGGGADEPEAPPQDLSNTWGFSRNQPLQPRYVRINDPSLAAPNPVGFYSGVSVQGNHVPPFPAKQMGTPPVVMTWAGFERAPEGSRVFFELSADAAHEVTTDGLTLRIRMRNTKVNVRNNLRYLDLRYFKTPVRTVKVTRRGRDTVATVVLKRDAVPVVQIIEGKAGYKLLVVQFSDADVGSYDADASSSPPTP
jgi:hypothetical protein